MLTAVLFFTVIVFKKAYNGINNPQLYTFLVQSDLQNATPLGHFWFYIFESFHL